MNKLTTKDNKGDIIEIDNWCSGRYLVEIISIPDDIKLLWVFDNQLTSLPKLPNNLEYLSCERNNIKQLTDLRIYKNLTAVDCDICCFQDYMLEMKNVDFEFFC